MPVKNTPTITEILARLNKVADDTAKADVDTEMPPQAEVGTEENAPEPCNEPACHGMITDTEENNPEPDSLENIAKKAAAFHRKSLQKEAAAFGRMFAGAVLRQFKAAAEGEEVPVDAPDDAEVGTEEVIKQICPELTNDAEAAGAVVSGDEDEETKTAEFVDALMQLGYEKLAEVQEEAYFNTLCKLAAEESYGATVEEAEDIPSLGDVAEAVQASADAAQNSASAANALAQAVADREEDDEDDEDDEDAAAQDAYDQTVDAIQNAEDDGDDDDEDADADVDDEDEDADDAAQDAYDQTVDAIQNAEDDEDEDADETDDEDDDIEDDEEDGDDEDEVQPEVVQDAYNRTMAALNNGQPQ